MTNSGERVRYVRKKATKLKQILDAQNPKKEQPEEENTRAHISRYLSLHKKEEEKKSSKTYKLASSVKRPSEEGMFPVSAFLSRYL